MATASDVTAQSGGNGSNAQGQSQSNKKKKLKKAGCDEKEPINILVIGPTGVGKSTLINSLFGEDVAEVGEGARSVTTEIKAYEGEHEGVKIKVYDSIGFRDTGGKTDCNILLDIAKHSQFDLILICSKLEDRFDRDMFSELAFVLNEEVWKRTVVVLTQANRFLTLGSVKSCPEVAIKKKIDEYKKYIIDFLSKHVQDKQVLGEIPICIAGSNEERVLTTDDWLKILWQTCIDRCSKHSHPLLKSYAEYRRFIKVGIVAISTGAGATTGALTGAVIGAKVGSVVPVIGTAIGAGVGAGIGMAICNKID